MLDLLSREIYLDYRIHLLRWVGFLIMMSLNSVVAKPGPAVMSLVAVTAVDKAWPILSILGWR